MVRLLSDIVHQSTHNEAQKRVNNGLRQKQSPLSGLHVRCKLHFFTLARYYQPL